MSARVLPDEVVSFLTGGKAVVLATVNPAGYPITTIMTWVLARDRHSLAFAIDLRGQAIQNIRTNGKVAFEILGDSINYGCRGEALIVKEPMDTPPFPSALVEVAVVEVRNHASPGVLFQGPRYTFTQGKAHRLDVERAIYAELKGESGVPPG